MCQEQGYETHWIKASDLIRDWHAEQNGGAVLEKATRTLGTVTQLQDLGDNMRAKDPAGVAKAIMRKIARLRAQKTGQHYSPGAAVIPDDKKRVYLIDSIRHPAEIHLLRRTYGNSFALVGVVCEEEERKRRILGKYFTVPEGKDPAVTESVDAFIRRDSDDPANKHGQHVADAFFEADFFIDNSTSDEDDRQQLLDTDLGRLLSIISHERIVRPTIEESAMHHAHSARVRSACLSRQVGAALVDRDGTVVATGTNEVPAAGGGVYGERFLGESKRYVDHRCAFRPEKICSSNVEQNGIIDELISGIEELSVVSDRVALAARIRKTRLGGLIEFSRAVHAEMDALLSAGREGVSTIGTRLFVTTFPCHYCARHIVSAGVYEVQFIEPYPKSLAIKLHSDAIEVNPSRWVSPELAGFDDVRSRSESKKGIGPTQEPVNYDSGKVLFKPFVGIAPRAYVRAFEKTWQLKDKTSGELKLTPPEWGSEWATLTVGYPELEALLAKSGG